MEEQKIGEEKKVTEEQKVDELKKEGPKQIIRIPTGIANFDELIEGGFIKTSTNLIIGGSGCGKSIFSIQFLMEGIRRNERCLYVTFEEKKHEFYDNMSKFGFDLKNLEEEGNFYFLEYTPEKVKSMLEEGGGAIENIVLTRKISRIVIDSITSFDLLFEREIEKRQAALELFGLIRKWNCTSLLTYERSPSMEKKDTSRVFDFESDSIIYLYLVRDKIKRARFIEVLKMRGTNHSLSVYPYEISDKGITITKEPYEGSLPSY